MGDDGRLTDSKGRTIDFKNTLIIMTSNVGAKIIEKESGIQSKKSNRSSLDINSDFLSYSSDAVLDPNVYKQISEIMIKQLQDRMKEKEIQLDVRNAVKEILV